MFGFKESKWPVVQSVCRHWRNTAVHMPALWSHIHVHHRHLSTLPEDQQDFVSTMFARSGACPLYLRFRGNEGGFKNDKLLLGELESNSWRIQELRVQSAHPVFLDSCLHKASQLKTLMIDTLHVQDDVERVVGSNWQIPRLHTLIARSTPSWHGGAFRALCHLVLEEQQLDVEMLRGLHSLLASNSQLEDLVLNDVWGEQGLATTLDALPSVNMPRLRRISLGYSRNPVAVEGLVRKKLVLEEGHAIAYSFPVTLHHLSPPQRLFVGNECIVGTSAWSNFLARAKKGSVVRQCAMLGDQPQLQELWLWLAKEASADMGGPPVFLVGWFESMREVKKIVLDSSIDFWLGFISNYRLFPSLTELQLHRQLRMDESAILKFLKTRAQRNPIQTLRIVRYPHRAYERRSEAFRSWRKNASVFTELVPHVSFEDAGVRPVRMELPAVCTTSSSPHCVSYWHSWESLMFPVPLNHRGLY
ncbi:hypothetical protein BC835DRAFT_1359129 [Cytidiella melzeri]|nr:hypothetical protein BC835DRAFT_1359129 [Cytidiella melzeri]